MVAKPFLAADPLLPVIEGQSPMFLTQDGKAHETTLFSAWPLFLASWMLPCPLMFDAGGFLQGLKAWQATISTALTLSGAGGAAIPDKLPSERLGRRYSAAKSLLRAAKVF